MTSSGCNNLLIAQGIPNPRTCAECGLFGSCRYDDKFRPTPPAERKGDWLGTYTGKRFWPLDPRPDEVDIEDIATALGNLCRYGGHVQRHGRRAFYSVAEHCVHMTRAAPLHLKFETLMHDASEAYLIDVPRPAKVALAGYKSIEAEIEKCIARKFGLRWPMSPEIKALDERIIVDEKAQIQHPALATLNHLDRVCDGTLQPLGIVLQFWSADQASEIFLRTFNSLYRPL